MTTTIMTTMKMVMVMVVLVSVMQGVKAMAVNDRSVDRMKRSTADTSEGQWSEWYNSDHPWMGEGDFETTDRIEKTRRICRWDREVAGAQCRVVGTNKTFDSSSSAFLGDLLLQACSSYGLICLNSQQLSGSCQDYEVRFLCQALNSEDTGGWLFPNLDYKIYILLAAVPLVVIVLRVLWSCWCKPRFRRSRHGNRRRSEGERHRDSEGSEGSLSTSSSQASINSALANPPPAYTELFGDNPSPPPPQQPVVFSISGGGECAGCGKCIHHLASTTATAAATQASSGMRDGAFSPSTPTPSTSHTPTTTLPASPADEVFVTPPSTRTTSAVVHSPNNNTNGTPDSQGRGGSTTPAPVPSSSALQGASASPPPPPSPLLSSHSSLPILTSSSPSSATPTTPSRCMCSCHRVPPSSSTAASGHVNLAFIGGDSVGDVSNPSCSSSRPPPHPGSVSPPPAPLYPGMHKPVFPFARIGSTSSFTSYTSLPDYEEALEMLQKNGLFLKKDEEKEKEGDEGKK